MDDVVQETELFLDGRRSLLRVRWSASRTVVQLSIWRDGRCVATHSLDRSEAARLSTLLTSVLAPVG